MSKRDELMKYLSLTPWNTNPAILNEKIDEIVKEEGSSEDSSDFSTAEVIFYNVGEAGSSYDVHIRTIDPQEENGLTESEFSVEGEPVTKTVLLYKGKYFLDFSYFRNLDFSYVPITTDGFILDIEKEEFYIAGNGTFTAKGTLMN